MEKKCALANALQRAYANARRPVSGPVRPVRFWILAAHARVRTIKWVWHLLVADRQRVCAGKASCCYGLPRCPLAQKRGGAKNIREVVNL